MNRKLIILPMAALMAVMLAAAYPKAPAGAYKVGTSQVTLGRMWSNFSREHGFLTKATVLSVDGPYLNRMLILDGISPGEKLIKARPKEEPSPAYRADMSAVERIELVTDLISAMGYQRVETSRPRPAKLGDADGVRIDLTFRTPPGLDMSGLAAMTERDGKFYLILYIAPTEHYFATLVPEVESVIGSFRFAPAKKGK